MNKNKRVYEVSSSGRLRQLDRYVEAYPGMFRELGVIDNERENVYQHIRNVMCNDQDILDEDLEKYKECRDKCNALRAAILQDVVDQRG